MATTVKLDTGALPKSNAGRKAIQPDASLVEALSKFFSEGTIDENGRPLYAGPQTDYETEGKAQAAGRRHKNAVAEATGLNLRVNINQLGEDGPYRWRLYVPATASKEAAKSEGEGNES